MGNEEQRDWLGSATPVFGDLQDKSRAASDGLKFSNAANSR